MDDDDLEKLEDHFATYDRCVSIVSCFEVWFTRSESMPSTVKHFERYPAIQHPDGNEATPDFTVLFTDGTALVGEIARVALEPGSFESLWKQIRRYGALTQVPSGCGDFQTVESVDVVVVVPPDAANRTCDRVEERRASGEAEDVFVSVFEVSQEGESGDFTFIRSERAGNPRPRGYSREPSLESWLEDSRNADTLRGKAERYGLVKAERRFCNDPISELYLTAVLWSQVFAEMAEGEKDLETTREQVAEELRRRFGKGRVSDVDKAFELLRAARLVERRGEGWVVDFRQIGAAGEPVEKVLLRRLKSPPRGPITHAERARMRRARGEKEANVARQEKLDLDDIRDG